MSESTFHTLGCYLRSQALRVELAEALTIIVPTRNEVANIPGFLQALPVGCRLIVVDFGGDGTAELVGRIRPERSTVIRDSGNVSVARHIGAELATTPWLLFTDADVGFEPDYFAHVRMRMMDDDADAWYGPKLSRGQHHRYYRAVERGQATAARLGVPAVSGSSFLVRRSAYAAAGGFDPRLSCNEDSELGWRLARLGYRVQFDARLQVLARDHRRLEAGRGRKIAHTLLRCGLLYLGWMPDRWREHDWGYWAGDRVASTRVR